MRALLLSAIVLTSCAQFGPTWDQSVPSEAPTKTFGDGKLPTQTAGGARFRSLTGPSGVLWWNAIGSESEAPIGPLAAAGTAAFLPSLVSHGLAIGNKAGKTVAWDLAEKKEKWNSAVSFDPKWMATDGTYVCGAVMPGEIACLGPAGETTFRAPGGASDLVVRDGVLYVVSSNVTAYDAKSGAVKFTHPGAPRSHIALSDGKLVIDSASSGCPDTTSGCVHVLDAATGAVLASKGVPQWKAGDGSLLPNAPSFLYFDAGKAYFTRYADATAGVATAGAFRIDLATFAIEEAPEAAAILNLPGVWSFQTIGLGELLADGTLYVYVNKSGPSDVCRVNVKAARKDWCMYTMTSVEHHANLTLVDGKPIDPTGAALSSMNDASFFRESWGFSYSAYYEIR